VERWTAWEVEEWAVYLGVVAEEDEARHKYGPGWERALRTIREAKAEEAAREAAGLPKRRRRAADPDAPVQTRQGVVGKAKRLKKRRRQTPG
jgi:hypothetical protein